MENKRFAGDALSDFYKPLAQSHFQNHSYCAASVLSNLKHKQKQNANKSNDAAHKLYRQFSAKKLGHTLSRNLFVFD